MAIHGLAPSSTAPYPPHFDIEAVIRPNVLALLPYRCARDDYQSGILLDANENALGHSLSPSPSRQQNEHSEADGLDGFDFATLDLHRYPDPSHPTIKSRLAEIRGLKGPEQVFLGVGSDEVIDLLMRVCLRPGKDKVMTMPPTYGMFGVCAQVNDVEVVKIPLNVEGGAFQLRLDEVCPPTHSASNAADLIKARLLR